MPDEIVDPVEISTDAPAGDVQQSDSSTDTPQGDVSTQSESSTEGVNTEPKTALEAVKAALAKNSPTEAPPAEETVVTDPAATPAVTDAAAQAGAEDAADGQLPFAKHPRFKQVLTERKQFKAQADTANRRVAELEPKAKNYDQLETFARNSGFDQEYFTDLLYMGRLMKEDPFQFYESFREQWAKVETMVGARLPQDLQQRVQAGTLDGKSAQELAASRTRDSLNQERLQRQQQQSDQQRQTQETERQQREVEDYSNAVGTSVSGWERQWKGSDPDYAIKQPFVSDRIKAILIDKPGATVQDVLAACNQAKKEVTEMLRKTQGARPAIRPNTSSTTVDTKGQPGSMLEAAKMRLEQRA